MLNMNKFWTQVMPACISEFEWGKSLSTVDLENDWEKSLKGIFAKMVEAEFNVFLAKMVIKASSAGVQGVELTEKVALFKGLREGK